MPHWAGMLTEAQHPHPEIVRALRQASWDLFFRANPVCAPPEFVSNPGINLEELLEGRPLLVLAATSKNAKPASPAQIEKWKAQLKEELELRERLKGATHPVRLRGQPSAPGLVLSGLQLEFDDPNRAGPPGLVCENGSERGLRLLARRERFDRPVFWERAVGQGVQDDARQR
jgi:hypothetical protein